LQARRVGQHFLAPTLEKASLHHDAVAERHALVAAFHGPLIRQ
jgi:hypothetical protein